MKHKKHENKIYRAETAALGQIDDHVATECIRRFAPSGFPTHLAIHDVSITKTRDTEIYSSEHSHMDHDEINILLSKSELVYRISLDDEVYEVSAPVAVWIPAGTRHSANVLAGEGFFICMRMAAVSAASTPATE
ncbi:MAG TPA: hypothetical protein VIM41_05605 [Gammaproteobacteria bacterium]